MPGLDAILSLISAVDTVEEKLNGGEYIRNAVMENEKHIVEMNVNQLYDWGQNSLGISINTYRPYTPYTIQIKQEKNQPVDRVTLRDTGAFHESFIVVADMTEFYITATDSKTAGLIEKYGNRIFGLVEGNLVELAKIYIAPNVEGQIHKELFGV